MRLKRKNKIKKYDELSEEKKKKEKIKRKLKIYVFSSIPFLLLFS